MDINTLRDRANDAINTIIRMDESTETGELLQPCIEGIFFFLNNILFLPSTYYRCGNGFFAISELAASWVYISPFISNTRDAGCVLTCGNNLCWDRIVSQSQQCNCA